MIGYVTVGTNDMPRAAAFYDALLATLGAKRFMEADRFIAWAVSPTQPSLGIIKPYDGNPATVGNGVMVALVVANSDDPRRTAVLAAGLYARCRWAGFTIRSANDCLIAASCIELGQPLLHRDSDFDRIAAIEPALSIVPLQTQCRGN